MQSWTLAPVVEQTVPTLAQLVRADRRANTNFLSTQYVLIGSIYCWFWKKKYRLLVWRQQSGDWSCEDRGEAMSKKSLSGGVHGHNSNITVSRFHSEAWQSYTVNCLQYIKSVTYLKVTVYINRSFSSPFNIMRHIMSKQRIDCRRHRRPSTSRKLWKMSQERERDRKRRPPKHVLLHWFFCEFSMLINWLWSTWLNDSWCSLHQKRLSSVYYTYSIGMPQPRHHIISAAFSSFSPIELTNALCIYLSY